ncbi:hypothetical protein AA12717_3425 [Gluconacetobacter sacchari DSM 12717]|uniref:Uncharacterized protein n=1 Tax=Gluconacetobacter sacchari DSM 12717 TaxID=1307940 RepID=A0ABQ0PBJ8_9PROT|nr:hypothetical protein AA12717_3425 [Gluconacetobacter sacchari DSM 12717]
MLGWVPAKAFSRPLRPPCALWVLSVDLFQQMARLDGGKRYHAIRRRMALINDLPIDLDARLFHWP